MPDPRRLARLVAADRVVPGPPPITTSESFSLSGKVIDTVVDVTTTDATQTTAYTLSLADGQRGDLVASVLGARSGSADTYRETLSATFRGTANALIQIGSTDQSALRKSDNITATSTIDSSGRVRVTGVAGQTWQWRIYIGKQVLG